jgi:phosphoribosylformylglycinamidine synthase
MWQFVLAIEGIADACKALKIPVVSGNVSFYNETNGLSIYPTPVIGMVGLLEDAERAVTPGFKAAGDVVLLLGASREDLGGTEYLRVVHHREQGIPPVLDLDREAAVQALVQAAADQKLLRSAHDCSEGGLAVALAEATLLAEDLPLGAVIDLDEQDMRADGLLFGESQSRIIVSVRPEDTPVIEQMAEESGVPCAVLGHVGGDRLTIAMHKDRGAITTYIDRDCAQLNAIWRGALRRLLKPAESTV